MKQFWKVFKFEFAGLARGKWFRISTILICALIAIVMFVPRFLDIGSNTDSGSNVSDSKDHIGLYDPTGVFSDDGMLKAAYPHATLVKEASIDKLKTDVTKGTLEYGIYIKDASTYEFMVKDTTMNDTNETIFAGVMKLQYQMKQFIDMGVDPSQAAQAINSEVKGETIVLGKDGRMNYFYTYILIFMLYFVIIFYGQMTATNVASEKGNRSMEILVTSTSSNALIFGKVLAGAAAGIVQIGVILAVSMLAYQANIEIWNHSLDFLFNIPASVLLSFAVFGTFGYLFYTFIYGAVGSMVSKVEEVSSAISPITIIFILAFFVTFMSVMMNPDTILSTIASYVPFTSCMAMFARVAMGSVETWQVVLSAVILISSTVGIGFLGAKLYRNGTLYYGNNFKFKNIIRNMKKKD